MDIDIEDFRKKDNRESKINDLMKDISYFTLIGTQINLNGFEILKKLEVCNIDVTTAIEALTCLLIDKLDNESNIFTDLNRMIETCEELLNDCNPNSYNSIENLMDILEDIKSELEDFEGISGESINYNDFVFNNIYLNLKKRFKEIGYNNIKMELTSEEQRFLKLKEIKKDKNK